jgi:uncharacterized protein YndB with AHSA1/START domain
MASTRIRYHVNAPRAAVYRAVDAQAVAKWMAPRMTNRPRTGKATAHTDTHHGRFVSSCPNEHVVEVVEFETNDPALRGEMTIAITLTDADGGTDRFAVYDGLPPGVAAVDNG